MRTWFYNHAIFFLAISTLVLAQCVVAFIPVYPISARVQNDLSGGHKLKVHCKSVDGFHRDFGDRLVENEEVYTVDYKAWAWSKAEIWCELSWESDNKAKHGGDYKVFWPDRSFVGDDFPYKSSWSAKDDGIYILNFQKKKSRKYYNWDK